MVKYYLLTLNIGGIIMEPALIVVLVALAVVAIVIVVLYFLGRRAQKKQEEQKAAMEAAAQTMSFFIIDKKKMKIKDAGLPKIVLEQTPKYLRRTKLPIIKVKVGPKVMSLIVDTKIYPQLLPKQEVKATVSGIYVTAAKRIRGPVYEPPKKKKLFSRNKK